jgi:hypothetical protein
VGASLVDLDAVEFEQLGECAGVDRGDAPFADEAVAGAGVRLF